MAGSFDFRNLARTNMGDSTIRVILVGSNFHRDLINLILIGFIIVYFIQADSEQIRSCSPSSIMAMATTT